MAFEGGLYYPNIVVGIEATGFNLVCFGLKGKSRIIFKKGLFK